MEDRNFLPTFVPAKGHTKGSGQFDILAHYMGAFLDCAATCNVFFGKRMGRTLSICSTHIKC